jgi:hypothetical protein
MNKEVVAYSNKTKRLKFGLGIQSFPTFIRLVLSLLLE